MKTILALLLIAQQVGTINSCNDAGAAAKIEDDFQRTYKICMDRGGVPVIGYIEDMGHGGAVIRTLIRCDFQQSLLRGER